MKKIMIILSMVVLFISVNWADTIAGINLDNYVVVTNPGHYVLIEKFIEAIELGKVPFINKNAEKEFLNKLKATMHMSGSGNYTGAANKIRNDILPKVDSLITNYNEYLKDVLNFQIFIFEHPEAIIVVNSALMNGGNIINTSIAGLGPKVIHVADKDDCSKVGDYHFNGCDGFIPIKVQETSK